jgi:glycine/D-amino acid oxidase-like deaminating enzyme
MPRTRYAVSPWVYEFPASRRPEYPRARGELSSQVVVIGGGLTGCATAYACATAGIRAIVLEAGRVGQGSTGRSAGLLLPDPGPAFRDIAQAHGLRAARAAFQAWRRASLDAAALLRRLGIKCRLDPQDALIVGGRDAEKAFRRELDARTEAGLEVTQLSRKQLLASAALDGAGAIKMHDAFGLDPYRAGVGLAAAAVKRGVTVFERTPLKKIRVGRKQVEIVAAGATVTASAVIVTTGSATSEFRQLRRHFARREKYLVLTEPMPGPMRKAIGLRNATIADSRTPHHRLRFTDDNRILVAGADQAETPPGKRNAVLVQRTGQLMYELLTMYPAISGLMPEFGWELAYGQTADGLPYIGPHRNFPRHLFALGGSGDSVTGAFLAARILVRHLQGAKEKADDVFAWTR